MVKFNTLLLVLAVVLYVDSNKRRFLRDVYPTWTPSPTAEDVGSRLILTPYIESGQLKEARNYSLVSGGSFPSDITSHSGYLTVNKTYNSNLFFWFFPAQEDYVNAPLLLWLQGGPGSSSMFGLFTEIGPFSVVKDNVNLELNPYSWHKNYSLIFIDNPIGTGFSFTDDDSGYATNQMQVGHDLYTAMIQFLTMFPELQRLPFFITGESYAGKYVPALAHTIHARNPTSNLKINLEGIAVGNGFTDPITTLGHSQFLYQLGLIDTSEYALMDFYENYGKTLVEQGDMIAAFNVMSYVLDIFYEKSYYENIYNFLFAKEQQIGGDYYKFLQSEVVRRVIHVGNTSFSEGGVVYDKMIPDFMNSVRPWLQELIENYRVLYYSGQTDVIMAYPLSVDLYNSLEFSAAEEYRNATRVPWYVDGELAGYMKTGGNFTEVLVRNAGHMVPTDQPKWALDLITRFTKNKLVLPEN